jgi:hypothetical protein
MRTNKKSLCILGLVLIVLFISSCATIKEPPKVIASEYQVIESNTQTKEGIEITLRSFNVLDTYSFPEMFLIDENINYNTQTTDYSSYKMYYPKDTSGKRWIYTYNIDGNNQLVAFKVKIVNNTDHILRMGDARIYLIVTGEDPINAITDLDTFKSWATRFEGNLKGRPGFSMYPFGFASALIGANSRGYKLINDFSKEILPGFSYEGILLFPAIVSWDAAELSFFDVTTKVDSAGNPIEKATFKFEMKKEDKVFNFDADSKRWAILN